jgi:CRP-like cAMP-binding protein
MREEEFLSMRLETAVGETFYECAASDGLIKAFENGAVKLAYSDDQLLFREGEEGSSVYLVRTGEVGLFLPLTLEDGMGFRALAGSFVGLPAAFSNEPYSMSAVARAGSELAVMSRDKFCDLIASTPALSLDVLRILAAETRAARLAIVESGMCRRTR